MSRARLPVKETAFSNAGRGSAEGGNGMEMRRAFDQGKYEVRLQGHLDVRWSDWLGGMEVEHLDDGTTRLVGELADQASLHGVLGMVRDLGALILSVSRMGDESHDMRDP